MKPLLILDRDGVINEASEACIKCPEEWKPIPGSLEAIARANHLGYRVVVVTNQSALAKGLLDVGGLNSIHQKLVQQLGAVGGAVDAFFVCPHAREDSCDCLEPNAGFFKALAERLRTPLHEAILVGGCISEIEAARKVGAKAIFVRTASAAQTLEAANDPESEHLPIFNNLAEVVEQLLVKQHP